MIATFDTFNHGTNTESLMWQSDWKDQFDLDHFDKVQIETQVSPWARVLQAVNQFPRIYLEDIDDTELVAAMAAEYAEEYSHIWVVNEKYATADDFPWYWRPSGTDTNYIYEFPRVSHRSKRPLGWDIVRLVPTNTKPKGVVRSRIIAGYVDTEFDICFVSYHEAEADKNFQRLSEKYPEARHVRNIKGIENAYKEAGRTSSTEMVWIVDADAIIMGNFRFDFVPPKSKRNNTTYCWRARNPINGLEYGFGAVKLFPRKQLIELGNKMPDFSTNVAFFQPVDQVSNITAFNKDPYRTWRAAFRECAKLNSNIISNSRVDENKERLNVWMTVDTGARFGRYALRGAKDGAAYGERYASDPGQLHKINDFDWLKQQFLSSMKKKLTV
tara:strand:+ start:217 stop:1371 length:1155 start_codon:yes stop_codon:yes gene_type:complete